MLETQLMIAKRLDYLFNDDKIDRLIIEIEKMLKVVISKLKKR